MRSLLCTIALTFTATLLAFTQTPKAPERTPAAGGGEPTAILHTTAGDLHCKLFERETPMTVANFIGLSDGTKEWKNPVSGATKKGVPLYDGTIFHRVIPQFMIQGGDPAGNGTGDPGYKFKDEIVSSLSFDRPGRLAMANSGPNTNGSQFFITEVPTPHLNGHHTIFGQCDPAAVELVKKIARMTADPSTNRPFHPVKINHIEIVRGGAAAPAKSPSARSSGDTKQVIPN
jgi:cyclophilin family peptidyl-prolyl cis-trans isomerase